MSHFVVFALVDKKTPNTIEALEEAIGPLFAPYDENIEVEPYMAQCYCVGRAAQAAVEKSLNAKFGNIGKLRDEFHALPEIVERNKHEEELRQKFYYKSDQLPKEERKKLGKELGKWEEETTKLWQKFIKLDERNLAEKMMLSTHPKKDEPKKSCEECKGKGKVKSTYNPKSKWDWYQIGGRWPGYLDFTGYDASEDPANYESCRLCGGSGMRMDEIGCKQREQDPDYKCNGCNGTGKSQKFDLRKVGYAAPVSEVLAHIEKDEDRNFIPFAIVAQEGWAERGKMGWWAVVHDEKEDDDWEKQALQILKANEDKLAVVVDCHI